jgi:molybdopterin molybdotransferase
MAQLSDDCFAFGGPLLSVHAMEQLILGRVTPVLEAETVCLRQATGRVLAADLVAAADLPPFSNSAVDGYAVRHADLNPMSETRLAVIDRLTAGKAPTRAIAQSEAIRIFTGAPIPLGADTVFMEEDCRRQGAFVIVPAGLRSGANRRFAGEDVPRGTMALPAGRRLAPQHVGLVAALGVTRIAVRRRVRVALFSTGDEIVEPGVPRPDAALYDANRYLIAEMLRRLGAEVTDLGILADDPEQLAEAIGRAAISNDLVLTSGGVSAGEADHVRHAVANIGHLVFWRIAIKPGRPVAMAVINGAAFVGLPGNPVAAFVTFARVVRPLLLRLAGALPEPLIALPVRSGFSYRKKRGRREYVRARLLAAENGSFEAFKYPQDGAGIIRSLTETDGLAELSEDVTDLQPGMMVGFLHYLTLVG